jgi:tripartite-type tricarboxylate transporter receptor subunit TctC
MRAAKTRQGAAGPSPSPELAVAAGTSGCGDACRLAAPGAIPLKLALLVMLAALILAMPLAQAQAYPAKPVRLIIPFPAGGGADIFARLIGRKMQEQTGQAFLPDNRAGASGIIGSEIVARAAPDGYTLLMGTTGTHATNPAIYPKLPYHPLNDFTPVSLLAEAPFVLLVKPQLPVKTVEEFIAWAKANPRQYTYGSSGIGSSAHLGYELFNLMAGIKGVHVPYKGLPPAMTDTIAGELVTTWNSISASASAIRGQQVRALGIGSTRRSGLMPEIPTIAESGLPGYELGSWYAFFAPAGMQPSLLRQVHAHAVRAVADPAMKQQFAALGAEGVGNSPDEFRALLERDIAKWAKVARDANVKAE